MLLVERSTPSAIAARTRRPRVLSLTLFLLLDSLCSCFIVLSPVRAVTLRRVDAPVARPIAPPVVILLESADRSTRTPLTWQCNRLSEDFDARALVSAGDDNRSARGLFLFGRVSRNGWDCRSPHPSRSR